MTENLVGPLGVAYPVPLAAQRTRPDHAACLGMWLLEVPCVLQLRARATSPEVRVEVAAPVEARWSVLRLIHLRSLPGVRPAQREKPDNEWEMGLDFLRPFEGEQMPPPDPNNARGWHVWGCRWELQWAPRDMSCRAKEKPLTDDDAVAVLAYMAQRILDGKPAMPPTKDTRARWDQELLMAIAWRRDVKASAPFLH